jgi:hypothetical protein
LVIRRTWMPLILYWFLYEARASAETLPRGIGILNTATRYIWANEGYYDEFNELKTFNSRFDVDFEPDAMRSGKAGDKLKKLYDNIKKYDTNSGSGQTSIGDKLHLGSQRGIVKPSVNVNILGIGFGVTKKITVFGGFPFIDAKVSTDLEFVGTNNALEVKSQLGDAAFDELKAGLDEAALLSKDTILSEITEKNQYKNVSKWAYKGIGDSVIGIRTGISSRLQTGQRYDLGIQGQLTLPTGPAYDPDSLTQIQLSQQTKSIGLMTDNRITWTYFSAGAELGGDYGFPYSRQQRVPESNETLISIERKVAVNIQPGVIMKATAYSLIGNATYRSQYKIGINQRRPSTFSGSLAGNYGALGRASQSYEAFHELALILTTVKLYKQQKFIAPFILTLTGHDSFSGKNASRQRYIELALIAFFSTPMASR